MCNLHPKYTLRGANYFTLGFSTRLLRLILFCSNNCCNSRVGSFFYWKHHSIPNSTARDTGLSRKIPLGSQEYCGTRSTLVCAILSMTKDVIIANKTPSRGMQYYCKILHQRCINSLAKLVWEKIAFRGLFLFYFLLNVETFVGMSALAFLIVTAHEIVVFQAQMGTDTFFFLMFSKL